MNPSPADPQFAAYVLRSGRGEAGFNMALDEALLHAAARLGRPVLRFYGWTEPAASFGYFQRYAEIERLTPLRPLVRRPTGGGLVPHEADWTYSLVFPPVHEWYSLRAVESYRRVHEWIQAAFAQLGVRTDLAPAPGQELPGQCFQGHERYDLLYRGQKLAGAAQRRTREGLLIQGSIQPQRLALRREVWEQAMGDVARVEPGAHWADLKPDAPLLAQAEALVRRKYSRLEYNCKR
jgi:lipoyl(octanoyl) transferase